MKIKKINFNGPYSMLIDGKLVTSKKTFPVYNPANNKVIASAPLGTKKDLENAVGSANRAFKSWAALSWDEREVYITRFADALEANKEELITLLTLEQGKPRHSMATVETEASIYWMREIAKRRIPLETIEDTDNPVDHEVIVDHVPLGVVGAITPWNFPTLLFLWKVAPCLMTGNTMVVRPSSSTPLCTLRCGEIAQSVLPPGVFNIISARSDIGQMMIEHPDIAKMSFTGSTETGKIVVSGSANTLKRVTLELGGNDACIIMPDADIKKVLSPILWAAYGNSGQWCIGIKRIYVHSSMHEKFVKEFVNMAKTLKVGDGMDPTTDFGPMQNRTQYNLVVDLFEDVKKKGYKVPLGGTIDTSLEGNFIPLTVVDNPPDDSRIVKEEPFGPIVPILSYETVDEAVERANDTKFGLAGSVWGEDREKAIAVAKRLETGTVWVNEIHLHGIDAPFGGHKESGLGVENGHEGLCSFTNTKTYMFKK